MELAGRTALLTGATGGLGIAIAKALAGRGASVTLSARKPEALEALAAELPGDGHTALPADLAEPGAAEKLAAEAGDVDILVANAGLPGAGWFSDFTPEQVTRALRVNLEAPMLLARALFPAMLERGSGHLVFVASLAGKAASPRSSIYNATKFGLRGFALGLRTDLGPRASASRSSRRASSARPGCSPTPAPSRHPGWAPPPRSRSAPPWSRRSSETRSRWRWRRCSSGPWLTSGWSAPASRCGRRAAPPARRPPKRSPTGTLARQALDDDCS